jgi:hypothetical protein
MMELTNARVVQGDEVEAGRDHDLVRVEETIELDGPEMERVINQLVQGNFANMSEKGRWQKLKDIGMLTERHEETTGAGF